MKIGTFKRQQEWIVGVVDEAAGTVRPFELSAAEAAMGVTALIGRDPLPALGAPIATSGLSLQAPMPRPARNVFCVGKNYFEHAHEFANSGFDSSAAQGNVPKFPIVFSKVPECVTHHEAPILIDPAVSEAIDYEAELAVIIGKGGRGIKAANAFDHVWGYTIINDVTARDLQGRYSQWLIGKSQDSFGPMGPYAVLRDDLNVADTSIRCEVNGELRQDSNTGLLIFDIPTIIETISAGITLQPGDVIATGTPAGVGIGFQPPRYLKDGDVVSVTIDGIGTLTNSCRNHH